MAGRNGEAVRMQTADTQRTPRPVGGWAVDAEAGSVLVVLRCLCKASSDKNTHQQASVSGLFYSAFPTSFVLTFAFCTPAQLLPVELVLFLSVFSSLPILDTYILSLISY